MGEQPFSTRNDSQISVLSNSRLEVKNRYRRSDLHNITTHYIDCQFYCLHRQESRKTAQANIQGNRDEP